MVLSHSGVQTRNFKPAATIAALRSQVGTNYKGRAAPLIREKKRLRRSPREKNVEKLKEIVKRRNAKISPERNSLHNKKERKT